MSLIQTLPYWRVSSLFLVARLLDQMDFAFHTKNGKLWALLKHDPTCGSQVCARVVSKPYRIPSYQELLSKNDTQKTWRHMGVSKNRDTPKWMVL